MIPQNMLGKYGKSNGIFIILPWKRFLCNLAKCIMVGGELWCKSRKGKLFCEKAMFLYIGGEMWYDKV